MLGSFNQLKNDMKNSILLLVLIISVTFSLQAQVNKTKMQTGKIKIRLYGLSNSHPNKKQMVLLLNSYSEEFVFDQADILALKHENLIEKKYYFHTRISEVNLILIFCKNQQDALTVGESNFYSTENHLKFGVNGAVLFVASGKDERKINDILSWFAGEE